MKLGSIAFINSLPVDWGLVSGAVPFGGALVPGEPAALNEALVEGRLDVSPVSAFWYGLHADKLALLPDLCIGSRSGVRSVLLFARAPLRELGAGTRIAVTPQGRTTPALLEILCRARYGFRPDAHVSAARLTGVPEGFDAALVIGDDALTGASKARAAGFWITDLAEEWREWTGTPAVFAVWAARREFLAERPQAVSAALDALSRSRRWGAENQAAVIAEAGKRTGLAKKELEEYFSALSYEFDAAAKRGLRTYFDHATRLGLLPAVPDGGEVRPAAAR